MLKTSKCPKQKDQVSSQSAATAANCRPLEHTVRLPESTAKTLAQTLPTTPSFNH